MTDEPKPASWADQAAWEPDDPEDARQMLTRLPDEQAGYFDGVQSDGGSGFRIVSAERAMLSFYKHHWVYRISLAGLTEEQASDNTRKVFVLCGPSGPRWLDGSSAPMHEANQLEELSLDNDEELTKYVRFFLYFLRADEGAFEIVEPPITEALPEGVAPEVRRLKVGQPDPKDEEGRPTFDVCVRYGGGYYRARLAAARNGVVEMVDDEPLSEPTRLVEPGYPDLSPFRRLITPGRIRELLTVENGMSKTSFQHAIITGPLDLEFVTLRRPLILKDCEIRSASKDPETTEQKAEGSTVPIVVNLRRATGSSIELSKCKIGGGLCGDELHATLGVDLSGTAFEGPVSLKQARIEGQLSMKAAFVAPHVDDWKLNDVEPLLALEDATIGLNLDLTDAHLHVLVRNEELERPDGRWLVQGGQASGEELADDRMAEGGFVEPMPAVAAARVKVGGLTVLSGAKLGRSDTLSAAGVSVNLSGARLEGGLTLESTLVGGDFDITGVTIAGDLRLWHAVVHGSLNCSNIEISHNADLLFWSISVGGDLDLSGATIAGDLLMFGADVHGSLECKYIGISRNVGLFADAGVARTKIKGNASFYGARVLGYLSLNEALISGTLDLSTARVSKNLFLRGTHVDNERGNPIGVTAWGLGVEGAASFRPYPNDEDEKGDSCDGVRQCFRVNGSLDLSLSSVGNNLDLSETTFSEGGMILSNATVNGDVVLDGANVGSIVTEDSKRAEDVEADKYSLRIKGLRARSLSMKSFTSSDSLDIRDVEVDSLSLQNAAIGGGVMLVGSHVRADLTFERATISGSFDRKYGDDESKFAVLGMNLQVGGNLKVTKLRATGNDGQDNAVTSAIDLTCAQVGGNFWMDDATICGFVVLDDAKVGANLTLTGSWLKAGHPKTRTVNGVERVFRDALIGERLHVSGDLMIGSEDRLQQAVFRTGPDCDVGNGAAQGVVLRGAQVGGQLELRGGPQIGYLDLREAHCGQLQMPIDPTAPPIQGNLRVLGLTFAILNESHEVDHGLAWAKRQGYGDNWTPDAYEQLASFYRRNGRVGEARKIAIEKGWDELRHLREQSEAAAKRSDDGGKRHNFWLTPGNRWRYVRRWLFGRALGFGYSSAGAGVLLLLLVLSATIGFSQLDADHVMLAKCAESASTTPSGAPPAGQLCAQPSPTFQPVVYVADVMMPVVDFGQDSSWYPDTNSSTGRWAEWARWGLIAVGWILVSLLAAAATGLIKHD